MERSPLPLLAPTESPILSGADYISSLRGRNLNVFYLGERIAEPVDHPVIRPSINAVAQTYDLALADPDLATAWSPLSNLRVNRFLHVTTSPEDVVAQNRMQRRLGQLTGTCFQRCVGMDALNALFSLTFDVDHAHSTHYHQRFLRFLVRMQCANFTLGGAMTDPKGDRAKSPSAQSDPDVFTRIVARRSDGVVLRGAKMHQTGCLNSHWLLVMPGTRLRDNERDYAVVAAIPVDSPGLTYIYGRQSCDSRSLEHGGIDLGNPQFSGQEAMIVFDDIFVPTDHLFLDGETEFAAPLVDRFTAYHRRSYVCKTGVGDVLIGAAALIADYNGVAAASHVKDKLIEMAHLNETIYGAGIAASHESHPTPAGNFEPDDLLANVCKHNVTRFPYEMARLAQDLAGGLAATMPSERDLENPETGPKLRKYLKGRDGVSPEDRARAVRLIENMTLGRNAVGYLTESLHGAGSPQAQRIQIARRMKLDEKKQFAKNLAGIKDPGSPPQ